MVKILEKHEPSRSGTNALSFLTGHGSSGGSSSSGALRLGPIPADEASAVQNYVEHMLFLLMEEEAGQGRIKEIIPHCATNAVVYWDSGVFAHRYQGERWVRSWSLWSLRV